MSSHLDQSISLSFALRPLNAALVLRRECIDDAGESTDGAWPKSSAKLGRSGTNDASRAFCTAPTERRPPGPSSRISMAWDWRAALRRGRVHAYFTRVVTGYPGLSRGFGHGVLQVRRFAGSKVRKVWHPEVPRFGGYRARRLETAWSRHGYDVACRGGRGPWGRRSQPCGYPDQGG